MDRTFHQVAGRVIVIAVLISTSGCSVFMAANQPAKKNLKKLDVGTPRGLLLAEFGTPINTETRNGTRTDTFVFVQGYDKANKATRAFVHGTADLFTLGLWEIAATPGEAVFDGDKMVVEVAYDREDKVKKSTVLEKKLMAGNEVPREKR